jgi:hypothetical protein
MVQLIIALTIVSAATGIAVYRVIRYFRDPLRGCDGCDKGCGGCSLEELKNQIEKQKKTKPGSSGQKSND